MVVVPFVLAGCLMAAAQVALIRANPGVRIRFRRDLPHTPTATRVLSVFAVFSAVFGAMTISSSKPGTPADISWWAGLSWGLVLMFFALVLPAILVHLTVGLYQHLRNSREPVQPER